MGNNSSNTQRKKFNELEQGDVVWTMFGEIDPRATRAKAGYRPCIIVSNNLIQKKLPLALAVPITHSQYHKKMSIPISSLEEVDGYAEPYQIKAIDLMKRKYKYVGKISDEELGKILGIINFLIKPL